MSRSEFVSWNVLVTRPAHANARKAAGIRRVNRQVIDCLIAAYAVANDAVILNSDHHCGYIEPATRGMVRQEYAAA